MSKRTRKLRRLNRQLDEKLTPASTAMLYQITRRIRTAPISAYQQESIRHDVIEMLQEAESRGASPEDAIGGDIAAFCDSVLAEATPLTARERRVYALHDVLWAVSLPAACMIGQHMVLLSLHAEGWPAVPVTTGIAVGIGFYLLAVCCAVLLTRTLTHSSFTQVYNGHLTVRLLLIPWWLIFVLLAMFWDQPLWYINGPLVIALELLVLIVSLILSATLD